jgi:hypothetical protein
VILPPRRSVTRFFIPLIDVLILLFCIFLLMPFVSVPAKPDDDTKADAKAAAVPPDVQKLIQERDEAVKRLDRFRKEQAERYAYRVVEIDETGDLMYFQGGPKTILGRLKRQQNREKPLTREEEDAEVGRWVEHQKKLAGEKDLYILIQMPRSPDTGRPTRTDQENYARWFQNVPHGY